MAGPYFDEHNRQIIFNNNNPRPGRWREPEPRRYYREDEAYFYQAEGGRGRYHRGSTSQQQQPQQIIINNENFIDDHQPEVIERYERPRSSNTQRVYIQEQQIVKVRSKSPSKSPKKSPELSYETRRALDELDRLKKEKDHEELVRKMKHDLQLEEAKHHEEEEKRKEHEKKMKELAIEEWKAAEEKKKREAKEKEEEKEKIGKEYMRQQLRKDGYTEEEIERMMTKAGKKRDHSPAAITSTQIVIADRPTYLKVHKKHISPETLDHYKIKWKWADSEYIYIIDTIDETEQDALFEHTERSRERKLIKFAEVETTTVNKIQKDRNGRLLMVRKKDEKRSRSKSPAVVRKYFLDG